MSVIFTLLSGPGILKGTDQVKMMIKWRWWLSEDDEDIQQFLTALWRLSLTCKLIRGIDFARFVCGLPVVPQGYILIQWHEYICTTLNCSPVSLSYQTSHLLLMRHTKAMHFAKFYSSQPGSALVKSPKGSEYGTKTQRPVPTMLSTKTADPEKSLVKKKFLGRNG